MIVSFKVDYYKKFCKDVKLIRKNRKIKDYGKKTHLKVRMVLAILILNLSIQKNTKGRKAKDKLKLKKYLK